MMDFLSSFYSIYNIFFFSLNVENLVDVSYIDLVLTLVVELIDIYDAFFIFMLYIYI